MCFVLYPPQYHLCCWHSMTQADAAAVLQGSVSSFPMRAEWQPMPGSEGYLEPESVMDPHCKTGV